MNRWLCSSALVSLLTIAQVAHAQDAAVPAILPNTNDAPAALDDIVVTAQYKRESLQKAAIPVDVVAGDDVARAGVVTPSQLTNLVPALQLSQGAANSQSFFIRGVGTVTANSYTDPGVAFNIDGVYIGRPTSVRNTFFDIERVEVLKGPQGTLYGRNATGGAINVIPSQPVLGRWEGSIGASVGNYGTFGTDGFVNAPLGDKVALRISGTYNRHDAYLSDGTGDERSGAVRGQLLFQPMNDLTIRLSADYSHDAGRGPGATLVAKIDPFSGAATADGFDRSIGLQDPRTNALLSHQYNFAAGRFLASPLGSPYVDNSFWGTKAQIDANLGFAVLTVLAAHRQSSIDNLDFSAGFGGRERQHDHQNSVEVRLASPDTGLIRWLGGLYYYDEKIRSDYEFNLLTTATFQDLTTGTTSKAAFGRITLAPTDHLRFVGGIRFTDERKRFDGVNPIFVSICTANAPVPACGASPFFPFAANAAAMVAQMGLIPVTPPGADPTIYIQPTAQAANSIFLSPVITANKKLKTTKTTFRGAVEYDVARNSLLYASFETGFHAGGFSFAQIAPTFQPETIDAYTIGSKNRFFGGTLQVNLELFLWKYKDQQITHFATDLSGALVYITENAGASTNKGFEIEARYKLLQHTTVSTDVQYLHAKYNRFSYTVPSGPGTPPLVSGCPASPVPGQNLLLVNCAGFTALRSPKWTINAQLEQRILLGGGDVVVAAGTRYQSESNIAFEMLPGVTVQKAYFSSNISVDFEPSGVAWTVGACVNNIENNRPIGQALFNNQSNTFASTPMPPRTYGVRARYRW